MIKSTQWHDATGAAILAGREHLSASVEIPHIVILAAGEGTRIDSSRPKPLVPLLGEALIERTLRTCASVGARQFVVVVGYKGEQVRVHLGALRARLGVRIACVRAEDWSLGNGASTLAAAGRIGNRQFFLLMADHLVDPEMLRKLLLDPPGKAEVCVAVDYGREVFDLDDATKVRCRNLRVAAIGKDLEAWDGIDTGVFLCTSALFQALKCTHDVGQHSLSHGIAELASRGLVRPVDVTGCRWLDVDTPEALAEAERRLLTSPHKDAEDGFVSRWINRPL